MKILIEKKSNKFIEVLDGLPVKSNIPTIFTDRVTISSINKTLAVKVSNKTHRLIKVKIVQYNQK